ncbi:YidC/Oxa1 family membrane protein insertase [Streptomyces sp. NPDC102381]|uniref:YidC/Oxa1 family membrane protein insertase n=1 Tax=Streptomyces sp. NPDC102381 TaxID=3366164 RepID=UPI003807CA99
MLDFLTSAVFDLVDQTSRWLEPWCGSAATAVTVVLFTLAVHALLRPLARREVRGEADRSRILPEIQHLARRHRGDPRAFRSAVTQLRRDKGVSPFAGLGPSLLQLPILVVMFNLFVADSFGSRPNTLLDDGVLGARLGAYWPSAMDGFSPGPVGLFVVLLACTFTACWFGSLDAKLRADASPTALPGHTRVLLRLTPYIPLVFLVTTPVAACLYTTVSTVWVTVERWVLRRRLTAGPKAGPVQDSPAGTEMASSTGSHTG